MAGVLKNNNLPTWEDFSWPYLILPAAVQLGVLITFPILERMNAWLNRRLPRYHLFIVNHIGCLDHPYPRYPSFLTVLLYSQILCSLVAVGLFIVNAQLMQLTKAAVESDFTLGVFFTIHYLIMSCQAEFSIWFTLTPTQLVDVITLPAMLLGQGRKTTTFVSMSFLRTLSALTSFEKLTALGVVRLGVGEVSHEVGLVVLRFVALVVCFAGSVLVFETLGEVPAWQNYGNGIPTEMGNISFLVMFYWVIETLSTVGYGDFVPKTVLSRLVTIVCMISGVILSGVETFKLVELVATQKKGSGSFQKTGRPHVVLLGGGVRHVDETLLLAFLGERSEKPRKNLVRLK